MVFNSSVWLSLRLGGPRDLADRVGDLGESLGQLGVFVIFIAVLLFRPTGLFGARA